MLCPKCEQPAVKAGRYGRKKVQRYLCRPCKKWFAEPQEKPLGDVRLPDEKVRAILNCLVEGNSVCGTARLCDVEPKTVLRILKLAGEKCEALLSRRVRAVPVEDVQVDEAWTFCLKKERRKTPQEKHRQDIGDQFVFIAIERHTKIVLCWNLGRRDNENTWDFITKLRDATIGHFQLTSDAFQGYRGAIDAGLHDRVSYMQLIKLYGALPTGRESYRPAKIKGTISAAIMGHPSKKRACTSHVERQNGTLRQWCKRLTRMTYAFSKKRENLRAALALYFAHYDFCRVHGSLRVTPAMESGLTDHVWSLSELIAA